MLFGFGLGQQPGEDRGAITRGKRLSQEMERTARR
jgi:hypothetical protein